MKDYYRKRVEEYEGVYQREDPVRQKEQQLIRESLKKALENETVLEIAAGTGYWTESLSKTADKITCTDYVKETLEIAKEKNYQCDVEFKKEDAYDLSFRDDSFSGGMANFWFSHIPKERIEEFFREFHRVLKNGSVVFMADNNFDEGVGGELIEPEDEENTYKVRKLKDGSKHKILKNYYSRKELANIFSKFSDSFSDEGIFYGDKFWYTHYKLSK